MIKWTFVVGLFVALGLAMFAQTDGRLDWCDILALIIGVLIVVVMCHDW